MESRAALQNNTVFMIFSIIITISVIFYPIFQSMVQIWIENSTFTHAFLLFPITLVLIWTKRDALACIPIQSGPRVLVLLALTCLGWFISDIAGAIEILQLMLIANIINSLWIMLGRSVVSYLLFPLLYLFFAVPFGKMLILPCMALAADFTTSLLLLSNIPRLPGPAIGLASAMMAEPVAF
jgi:exosortase